MKGILLTSVVAALFFAVTASPRNLLRNGSFEAGRDGWMFDSKPLGGTFETLQQADAVDGNILGTLSVSNGYGEASLSSEWVPLEAGVDHTLGVSLRCDSGSMQVRILVWSWADANGAWNQKTESKKTVTVSTAWQRFSLAANLEPSRSGKYQVSIETSDAGTVYVDAVNLVEGEKSNYRSPSHLEMGVECSLRSCLFDMAETPEAKVSIYNSKGGGVEAELTTRLTDIEDQVVMTSSVPVSVGPRQTLEMPLQFPVTEKGYYKLETSLVADNQTQSCVFAFAVIDKNSQPPVGEGYFGVDMASHNLERQLDRALEMGVRNVRVHESLNWRRIEKTQGVFTWPALAAYDAYKDAGLNVLVYSDGAWQGQPGWANAYNEDQRREFYADFLAECVAHYSGVIGDFEVVNEPWGHIGSDEYLKILTAVYDKAKLANPSANMAAVTGYFGPQINFIKNIIDVGALDYMDVFTLHPYPRPARPEPSLPDMLKQADGWLGSASWNKPVWITEMGWTTAGMQPLPTRIPRPDARNNTELERAMYIVRSNIISIANGVDRVYWFYYSGDNSFYYSYDMFECDSNDSVMKTVPVYSAMTSRLRGYQFEKTLCEGRSDIYAYQFSKGSDRQIVAWNSGNTTSGMLLGNVDGSPAMYDMLGNPITVPSGTGGVTFFPLDGQPVYIEFAGAGLSTEVVSLADVQTSQSGFGVTGSLNLTNAFSNTCEFEITLSLPSYATVTLAPDAAAVLAAGEIRNIPFSFSITDPQKTAVSDDLFIGLKATSGGNEYLFDIASAFLFSKPLPPPESGIVIEAADFDSATFEPDPLWQPNLVRGYSDQNLLLRRTDANDTNEYVVGYDFNVEHAGSYNLQLSCTPFESGDNLSWSVNGGAFESNASSGQVGDPWVYSTHPDMWWRFKCVWHDMGEITLNAGQNNIRLRFDELTTADYGYMAVDIINCVRNIDSVVGTPTDGGAGPTLWYKNARSPNKGSGGSSYTLTSGGAITNLATGYWGNADSAFGLVTGSDPAAVAGSGGLFASGTNGTVTFMFKTPGTFGGFKSLFNQGVYGTGAQFEIGINGSTLRLGTQNGSAPTLTNLGTLSPDTWYYFCMAWDTPASSMTWYYGAAGDATLNSGNVTISSSGSSSELIYVGGRKSTYYYTFVGGYFQEIALYDRTLPVSAIQAQFDATLAP